MIAFLLAAGMGSRLGPLTARTPKPMLRLGQRPILDHNLRFLRGAGITRVVINTHHCGEVIQNYFGQGASWGMTITYSPEERLLGTAGALRQQAERLRERFVVLYADNLFQGSLGSLLAEHARAKPLMTIAVHHREDVRRSGEVVYDSRGRVERFYEKRAGPTPRPGWVSAGIMVAEPEVLQRIPDGCPSDLGADVIPSILDEPSALLMAAPFEGQITWVDTPDDYRAALRAFDPFGSASQPSPASTSSPIVRAERAASTGE